jgi:hypothetical protein
MVMRKILILSLAIVILYNIESFSEITEEFLGRERKITNSQLLNIVLRMEGNHATLLFRDKGVTVLYLLRPLDNKIEITASFKRDSKIFKNREENKVLRKEMLRRGMRLFTDYIVGILPAFFEGLSVDPEKDVIGFIYYNNELVAKWEKGELQPITPSNENKRE